MKNKMRLSFTLFLSLQLLACAGALPRKDFAPPEKIQVISVTNHVHIYAQDDTILNSDTLDYKLSAMNEEWKTDLHRAALYRGIGAVAFLTQVVALGVCLAQTNMANVLGWCGGSIAMGGITIPVSRKADALEYNVIHQYNSKGTKTTPEVGWN